MEISYDINDLLSKPEDYELAKFNLKDKILSNFGMRHGRCKIIVEDATVEATFGQALINLFLLSFFEGQGVKLKKSDLLLSDTISADTINTFFNKALQYIKDNGKDFDQYRNSVYKIINELCDIGSTTNICAGNTIDLLDFIKSEADDPDAQNLFSAKIPYGLQFSEIESIFSKKGKEVMKYYNTHLDRNLSPFTRSNTGINLKQATQTLCFIGLKPTFEGGVIPKVITSNFLKGLDKIEDYFIISKGARLALSTNYKMVRVSGYLTRKLSLLMIDHWHDNSIEDCHTKHYVEYKIENAKKLQMIDGRNYYDIINGKADYDHLKTINCNNDKELIGKTIALRSPVTCSSEHPCKTCYGKALSEINKNLNTGLVSVLLLTNILTQRLLSAKHLLATNTDNVNWGELFLDVFTVNMDSVYFAEDTKSELNFQYPSEDDYDEDTDSYKITEFDFKTGDDKKVIHYKSPTDLYLSASYVPKKKSEETSFKILSDSFSTGAEIFKYIPHNNMLTKSLQNILDLIESAGHLGITDYNDFVNKFADLLIENDMYGINSIHAEMITSRLITDSETHKHVDWSKDIINPYDINRVSKIVLNSPIATSLAFERLGDQLSSLDTYLKDEDSIMDVLYD